MIEELQWVLSFDVFVWESSLLFFSSVKFISFFNGISLVGSSETCTGLLSANTIV